MNKSLTFIKQEATILPYSLNLSRGFGHSFSKGATAMHRLVHGFFNAYSFMVGVLGSPRACRLLCPVDQPNTSAALSLVTSGGSLKTTAKEEAMLQHSHTQNSPKNQGNIQSKFDLFKHVNGGKNLVCRGLLSSQIQPLISELRGQYSVKFVGGFKMNPTIINNTPRKIHLNEILARQSQERGLEPMRLEFDLLIKRIKDGGHSGQFLADAFLSNYRNTPFQHSLNELIRLDSEGFRLFHQILHMRFIPGWSDEKLYEIEQNIHSILGGLK